jgi:hypothetical protein
MKVVSRTLIAVLATLLVVQPMLAWAGQGARVIPEGKVSLLADGKEINQFQSEMPLSEGSLMLCNGRCLVQTQSIQLVAQNQAVFALAEGNAHWDLTVKSGQVDFAMRTDAKPISFHTPLDSIQTERAVVPASTSSMVRGSIKVTEKEAVLSMQEGALQVMAPDGTQLLQPGQGIRLAAAGTTTTTTSATDSTPLYYGLTGTQWAIIGGIAVVGLGVGLGLGLSGGGDDNGQPASPK